MYMNRKVNVGIAWSLNTPYFKYIVIIEHSLPKLNIFHMMNFQQLEKNWTFNVKLQIIFMLFRFCCACYVVKIQ